MKSPKLKIFTEDNIGFVDLVDRSQEDAALKVVNSARISYKGKSSSFTDKDRKLSVFLYDHGHTSPFRHSWYTFHIKAPLFTFRQMLKYQVASYWKTFEINGEDNVVKIDEIENIFDLEKGCNFNEISGRYVKLIPEFYYPKYPRANPSHGNKQASVPLQIEGDQWLHTMKQACEDSYKSYQSLLEQGIAKEIARMILPQNIYSEAYWTVSLQSVIHFLKQRHLSCNPDSQYEIQMYADCIYKLVKDDLDKLGIELK